jgi:hypothetical protein
MRDPMKAVVLMAGLIVLFAVAATPLEAQYRRPWGPVAGGITLTDEQLARIQEIRLAFQEEILALETKWRKLGLEIDALAMKGQSFEAKLKEIESVEAELDKRYEDHWNKIRSVLTDDQKVLFDRYGGLGLGLGWGPGRGGGMALRRGLGMGPGRGAGYGMAPGRGRGYGAGWGRGYYCPWRRW